jgi:hypothetical protein
VTEIAESANSFVSIMDQATEKRMEELLPCTLLRDPDSSTYQHLSLTTTSIE